jgi:hypothetical protein
MSEKGPREKAWDALEEYAAKAELERIDALSDADVEAELRAAGMSVEPAAVPAAADSGVEVALGGSHVDGGVAYDAGGGEPASRRVLGPKGGVWRRLPRESFAYATAAAVLAVAVAGGVRLFLPPEAAKPLPPAPDHPTHEQPTPAPVGTAAEDRARAANDLRERAKAECDRGEWRKGYADLEAANASDAAGETAEWKALFEKARAMAAKEILEQERKGK